MSKSAKPNTQKQKFSFKQDDIELDNLLLDPNNYRFLDNALYKKKIKTRYHVDSVQESTLRLLERDKNYQLEELKKSIKTNGYVPMERLIVVPYKYKAGKYLVVEGNRRVAALKSLLQEHREGVIHLSDNEVASFSKIPCAVLQADNDEELKHIERVIMGIRHIAGPKEWGAYQQAQLITEMYEDEGFSFQEVGDHLGISAVEAARRYRAMRALKTMEEDELYAEKADPKFYRLFHELVALPGVRDRFGWDVPSESFADINKAREFYELIAPRENGDAGKLATYGDVRKLKLIIGNPKAETSLLDVDQPFSEALKIAELDKKPEGITISDLLEETKNEIQSIDLAEMRSITREDIVRIDEIIGLLSEIKKYHESVSK